MQTRRQKRVSTLMALSFVAATALVAGPAQAASGNGPYYAEPSWSQKLPAATRFVVLLDWSSQAVLDRETGLVWEQSPQTERAEWFFARVVCAEKTTGGRNGWRLPAIAELASLIDPSQRNPALPLGHPFTNLQSAAYWSATTNAEFPTFAWLVFFAVGQWNTFNKASFSGQVWCVRGGSNAEAY